MKNTGRVGSTPNVLVFGPGLMPASASAVVRLGYPTPRSGCHEGPVQIRFR